MRYLIKEKFFHLGQDSDITDENGQVVYRVDGKVLSLRNKMIVRDPSGNEVAEIERKLLSIGNTFEVTLGGQRAAEIHQHVFALLHQHFTVHQDGQPDIEMRGKLLQHDFTIEQSGKTVATVSRAWVSLTDTYGLETEQGQNDLLLICCVLAIEISQDQQHESGTIGGFSAS